jgi:protoporphyrinogen oxidase
LSETTVIVGAGLAGMSAAHHLRSPYRLIERSDRVGGLCVTEEREGFYFDKTGHWMHLRDPDMKALVEEVLPGGWTAVQRKAGIFSCGVFTRFPYQINTHGLPAEVVAENVLGFVDAHFGEKGRALREREPRTFGEFILRHLGAGFAKHFMFPYNEKLWTVHPDDMGVEWMGRFVPRPTIEQVVRGALGLEGDQAGYNAAFIYPKQGGIGAFADAFGKKLRQPAELGVHPLAIDTRRRLVSLSSGEAVPYGRIIATLALPELVGLCDDAPLPVRDAAAKLKATTVTYVNVAAKDVGAPPFHWIYLPEAKYPCYRIGSASSAVPSLAPAGCRSFYVEFSARHALPSAVVERQAVDALLDVGFLKSRDDVRFAQARHIPGAYVIYDEHYGAAKQAILEYLTPRGILAAGRYGRWEYSSMEDALLAGRECARKVSEA